MTQAIITKFLPVTNHRGARIKASAVSGTITISYPYEFNTEDSHRVAALALADKFGWLKHSDVSKGAGLPTQDGYAFFLIGKDKK